MLPTQSLIEESFETVPEGTAETYQSGCYDQQWYVRAKYKCLHCLKIHVALHDGVFAEGKGRDIPTAFTATCKLTGKKIFVKAWDPKDFREAAKKVKSAAKKITRPFQPKKFPAKTQD